MTQKKLEPYPPYVLSLLAEKSAALSKAHTFSQMGFDEITKPLWALAAGHEERLAPLLEGLGEEREAAVHRISAASCYRQAGDLARAVNLFRAALAGPLLAATRKEVKQLVAECLQELLQSPPSRSHTS